jgi:hypothetical protein
MNKSPVAIEKAVDQLFGNSACKSAIARMLCKSDVLSPELMDTIKEVVREEFPREFLAMKARFSDSVQNIGRMLSDYFSKEMSETIASVEDEARRNGVTAYFVGDFPTEMVRSGTLSDVRDVEVFAPNGGITQSSSVMVWTNGPSEYILPYMNLLGVEDTPFNRFALSRGIAADSVGIKVGTNDVLDPTHKGVPDILARTVSTILPPEFAYENMPTIIFRAIRLAGRKGMTMDAKLKKCISQKRTVGVPAERLLVEMATMAKQEGPRAVLAELGLEA